MTDAMTTQIQNAAITTLMDVFESTSENLSPRSQLRRAAAQDGLTAAYFYQMDRDIDPARQDVVCPDFAEHLLGWAQLASETVVLAMLDYRQMAAAMEWVYLDYKPRLAALLFRISEETLRELWGDSPEDA